MLGRLSIGTRLLAAFICIALFSVLAAYQTITSLQDRVRNEVEAHAGLTQIEMLLEMKSAAATLSQQAYMIEHTGASSTQIEAVASSSGKSVMRALHDDLQKWASKYRDSVGTSDTRRQAFLVEIGSIQDTIDDAVQEYINLGDSGTGADSAAASRQKLIGAVAKLNDSINRTIEQSRTDTARILAENDRRQERDVSIQMFVVLTTVLLAIGFGLYLSIKIANPLRKLRDTALRIAGGDLSAHVVIEGGDETGDLARAFNEMTSKLKDSRVGLEAQVRENEMKAQALLNQVAENEHSRAAILNLLEDIDSEKKNAENLVVERTHQLSDEKARLLASINSLSFGFIIADGSNAILIKNPALNKILEVVDEPQTLSDIAKYIQGVDLVASCKECIARNTVVEHKDISYGKKYLRIFCAPVLEGIAVIGNVVLIEDVTEAKVMERSRDEFFAVASHELRTPLTAIRGNADMILEMYTDKIVDKDMKEMLEDINSSSVRLIDVVNDFLEVSRLEQGRIEMKKEVFDIADVVNKVVRDLREMIAKKGLELRYMPPAEAFPKVLADKNKVEQILVNLVGNSSKFTKTGSITIELSTDGNRLRLRVVDTGVGISEHNQTLLFRKFQQAGEDMLARDVSQSTGLGLYICKLIVENMGGSIGLERSELGKGSTFFFTVPLA